MTPLRVDHLALWVANLERMREFCVGALGGMSGPLYENQRTGFRSHFVW
jgi:lactoylglutathione lyase